MSELWAYIDGYNGIYQKTLQDAIDLRNRILEEEYGEKI